MKSIRMQIAAMIATSGLVLGASACSNTTTSGGAGVSVSGPAILTHGMCAVLTINYVLRTDAGTPVLATSDQSYHVTAVNGSVFQDSSCTTPLSGDAVIHSGSNAVDVGFVPSVAGMPSGIMVVSASESLLTAGYQTNAN